MVSKTAKKWLIRLVILIAIIEIIALLVTWVAVKFVNDEVVEGSAYGFTIGDNKETSYANATQAFRGKTVSVMYPVAGQHHKSRKHIYLADEDKTLVTEQDEWRFYFGEGFLDSLTLTFSEGELVKIHKRTRLFEVP
jgi:hypothetical protein